MLPFFCVLFLFLHWDLCIWSQFIWIFSPFSFSTSLPFFPPFSFQVNRVCMEAVAMFGEDSDPESDPAAYSPSCRCVWQVSTYPSKLPQGQVWSTSHPWFLVWVLLYPTLVHRWSAPCSHCPCCALWALCTPLAPSLRLAPFVTLFIYMHPTLHWVQPSLNVPYFFLRFNFATFREAFLSTDSGSQAKASRLNIFQSLLKLSLNLWALLWRIQWIQVLWPYCVM
jgi:hypothetical protein